MGNAEAHETLETNPFFQQLDAEYRGYIANASKPLHCDAGQLLFSLGKSADCFFLLLDGEVHVEVPALAGPSLVIQRLRKGDVLGWSWLIKPYQWDFQARAVSDTQLLEFDAGAIRQHAEDNPAFGYQLLNSFMSLMSERLAAARQRMMDQWNPVGFA